MTLDISLEQVRRAVEAAVRAAEKLGVKENVAVVDAGASLKGFFRMDEAWLGSIDIAIRKARTARLFDMPTAQLAEMSQPGGELYNAELSNGGLVNFGGGLPIKNREGQVIGAIGVSGASVEIDVKCAEAGARAAAAG